LKGGFSGTQISPSSDDKASLALLTKIYAGTPIPTDPCGLVTFGRITQRDERQGVARVDYQHSDKQSIFARYIATQVLFPNPSRWIRPIF